MFETVHTTSQSRRAEAPPKSRASFYRSRGQPEFPATPTQFARFSFVERPWATPSGEANPGSFSPQRGGGPWLDFRAIPTDLQQSETVYQQSVNNGIGSSLRKKQQTT
jgi:hypothetical protein